MVVHDPVPRTFRTTQPVTNLDSAAFPEGAAFTIKRRRQTLRAMFDAAVASAMPALCVPPQLPERPKGRTIVVGAGKAAAAMARAVEDHWPGELQGVVVTRYGHAVPCQQIRVLEAGHPIPDRAGVEASQAILDAVSHLTADDLVLCLISGGGSSLLPALPPSISLEDEQELAQALLRSGAAITEINCVRKHVSLIKGGRLALAAAPARVHTLILSDVPGDDPAAIASGPTVQDGSTREEALAILAKYEIDIPSSIRSWLEDSQSETPKALSASGHAIIASARTALDAAATVAAEAGYRPFILGDAIEGEASLVGEDHAAFALNVLRQGQPITPPCALISGGETSVTVRGDGRGGRNAEFLLSLLIALQSAPGISAIAADTDGIDGTEADAGAVIDETSLARAAAQRCDAKEYLRRNDAHSFFASLGDLVTTGATLTNVNDFRAILIDAPGPNSEFGSR